MLLSEEVRAEVSPLVDNSGMRMFSRLQNYLQFAAAYKFLYNGRACETAEMDRSVA
jgi:hypothetical protein